MMVFSLPRFGTFGFLRSFLAMLMLSVLVLLLTVRLAAAQTMGAPTAFDISPWLQIVIGVATASVPVILGFLATWAKAHFRLAAGSNAAAILDFLVTSSSQTVVSALAKAPAAVRPIDVKNSTVAGILNNLSETTLAAMKLKNVTPEAIAARIDGAVQMALTPAVFSTSPLAKA